MSGGDRLYSLVSSLSVIYSIHIHIYISLGTTLQTNHQRSLTMMEEEGKRNTTQVAAKCQTQAKLGRTATSQARQLVMDT